MTDESLEDRLALMLTDCRAYGRLIEIREDVQGRNNADRVVTVTYRHNDERDPKAPATEGRGQSKV